MGRYHRRDIMRAAMNGVPRPEKQQVRPVIFAGGTFRQMNDEEYARHQEESAAYAERERQEARAGGLHAKV